MEIGFLLFPNLTQLDLTGPLQVLHRMPKSTTHLIAATRDPAPSDCGLSLVPTATFGEAPQLDLICIPGGFGVGAAMADRALIGFVKEQAKGARYLTSVCTGAFILGAAGLLKGKRATTHWAYRHLLPRFAATPVEARVVRDGDLFTGGGVTAGIDFAFTVMAEIAGEAAARGVQLAIEYDPSPPFEGGVPARTPEPIRGRVEGFYAPRVESFAKEVDAAAALLEA